MRRLTVVMMTLIVLLAFRSAQAQMTARGLGMGGAYTALARGVHAALWNPANLGLPDNPRFSFTFVGVGAAASNNAFSKAMYDQYLVDGADADNHIHWTEDDVKDILDAIPDNGLSVVNDVGIRALSFSVGRFALSVGVVSGSSLTLEKELFEIPLSGTVIGEAYDIATDAGQGLGYATVDLSYGLPVKVTPRYLIAAGLTTHFIYGGGAAQTEDGTATVALRPYGMDVDGTYEATTAYNGGGLGWGVDLGVAAQIGDRWTLSMAVDNVLGAIPFNENVETQYGTFSGDSLGVVSDFEEDLVDSTWDTEGEAFTVHPGRQLRLGAAYAMGALTLTSEVQQGFSNGALVSSSTRLGLGLEWKGLSWLPLRAGVAVGGRYGFSTAFGLGIRPGGFVLDLAVLNRGGVTPRSSKGVAVAVELGLDLSRKHP